MVFGRKIRIEFIIVMLSLFSMSCNRQEVIDVGMVASLSGTYSPNLRTARNGALLAVEQINNRKEKIRLNLIVEDDESDTHLIVEKTSKLIAKGIDILLMPIVSEAYSKVEDLITNSDVLALSTTISSDSFKNKDDNLIRMTMDSSKYGEALAGYALKEKKESVVIVYDSNNYAYAEKLINGFTDLVNSEIKDPDIQIISFNTTQSPSFRILGKQILDFYPDSVLLIANPFDSALICQHINEGNPLKLLSSWAFSSDFIKNGGRAIEGTVSFIRDESSKEAVEYQRFYADYLDRFGSEPSFQSLSNFNSVNYLYSILISQEDHDPESLKQAILDTGGYQGINLKYEINEYGDCSFPLKPYTVRDGQIVRM